jgi:hypothetical protein
MQEAADSGDKNATILIILSLQLEEKMRELSSLRREVMTCGIKADLSSCYEKADRIARLSSEIAPLAKAIGQLVGIMKHDPAYRYEETPEEIALS